MAKKVAKKTETKRGRKPIPIEEDQLRKLMQLNCTLDEVAAFFQCSRDTIERRMKQNKKIADAVEQGRNLGKLSVRRKQFELMNKDNAQMAIWLGKVLLNQRETTEIVHEEKDSTTLREAFQLIDGLVKQRKQS